MVNYRILDDISESMILQNHLTHSDMIKNFLTIYEHSKISDIENERFKIIFSLYYEKGGYLPLASILVPYIRPETYKPESNTDFSEMMKSYSSFGHNLGKQNGRTLIHVLPNEQIIQIHIPQELRITPWAEMFDIIKKLNHSCVLEKKLSTLLETKQPVLTLRKKI